MKFRDKIVVITGGGKGISPRDGATHANFPPDPIVTKVHLAGRLTN